MQTFVFGRGLVRHTGGYLKSHHIRADERKPIVQPPTFSTPTAAIEHARRADAVMEDKKRKGQPMARVAGEVPSLGKKKSKYLTLRL